ncbi:hypothetical protein ACVWXO_006282 [Bradyrhizobium sp. LM2.7]
MPSKEQRLPFIPMGLAVFPIRTPVFWNERLNKSRTVRSNCIAAKRPAGIRPPQWRIHWPVAQPASCWRRGRDCHAGHRNPIKSGIYCKPEDAVCTSPVSRSRRISLHPARENSIRIRWADPLPHADHFEAVSLHLFAYRPANLPPPAYPEHVSAYPRPTDHLCALRRKPLEWQHERDARCMVLLVHLRGVSPGDIACLLIQLALLAIG